MKNINGRRKVQVEGSDTMLVSTTKPKITTCKQSSQKREKKHKAISPKKNTEMKYITQCTIVPCKGMKICDK